MAGKTAHATCCQLRFLLLVPPVQVMLQSTNAAKVLDVRGLHFENWIKNGILPEAETLAEPIAPVVSTRPQRRAAASR
jgi:hypothetical protein